MPARRMKSGPNLLDQVFEKDKNIWNRATSDWRTEMVALLSRFHRREKRVWEKRNKCGEYSDRERGQKRKRHPENRKGTQKLFLPFPPTSLFSLCSLFVFPKLTNANEPKSTNEKKNKNEGSSVAKSNRRVGTAFKRSGRESERTSAIFLRRSTHDDDDDEKGGGKGARKWAL